MNGKLLGKKVILILFVLLLLLPACASTAKNESKPLDPIKFDVTPTPDPTFLDELTNLRLSFGPAPEPEIITHNGIIYYGFTKDQMVQLIKKNQAFYMLEEIAKAQHKKAEIYVMEINKLKQLASSEREQSILYQDMYKATYDEATRLRLEAKGYKIATFGSLVAIIALLVL